MQILLDVDEEEFKRIVVISQNQHYRNKLTIEQIIAHGTVILKDSEDVISRQAALNAITMAEKRWQAINNINKLPPVSETVTEFVDRCRECGKMKED